MNIRDDEILANIHEGYLVGGACRDILMGKTQIIDRDITIKNAEIFAKKISNELNGTFIELDCENKIYRVVMQDKINFFDISEMQGNNIEEDLIRRDFTINAIAYDLKNDNFIDITNGINDIQKKVLRHIKDKNFKDDPLRILRAFRFLAVTGFEMESSMVSAINKYLPLALNPAKERISYELMKLFGGAYASQTLLLMDEFGLLEKIFPCVIEMKQVPPNTHHHLDLFHHVVETVRQIEIYYSNAQEEVQKHLNRIDFGGYPRINHIKLAGFLHDIGKFSTWTIEESGRHRFIKHDDVGSKLVVPLLKNLKFSKKQIEYISCMIKNHIYPSNVVFAPELNDKVIMRYIRKMGDNVIDNIALAHADRLSARGIDITQEIIDQNLNGLNTLLNYYLSKRETIKPLPKLIDGNEIMKMFNLKPSPILGQILNSIKEEQLNGNILTKEDAVCYARDIYNSIK